MPASGDVLGRYRLLVELARGGEGSVWAANHLGPAGFERIVALKLFVAQPDRNANEVFLDEVRAASMLLHPAIVSVIDSGRASGLLYAAMQLVRGPSLHALLRHRRENALPGLPAAAVAYIGERIARALDHVFREAVSGGARLGLVHRDVSPQNILIDTDGSPRLTDFGASRSLLQRHSSVAGSVVGKPAYMSPEQTRGLPLDDRSDVHSLSAVLYECATGDRLFRTRGAGPLAVVRLVQTQRAPPITIPGFPLDLAEVIASGLAKSPQERPNSREFGDALAQILRRIDRTGEAREQLRMSCITLVDKRAYSATPAPTPPTNAPTDVATIAPPDVVAPAPRRLGRRWPDAGGGALLLSVCAIAALVMSNTGSTHTRSQSTESVHEPQAVRIPMAVASTTASTAAIPAEPEAPLLRHGDQAADVPQRTARMPRRTAVAPRPDPRAAAPMPTLSDVRAVADQLARYDREASQRLLVELSELDPSDQLARARLYVRAERALHSAQRGPD